MFWWKGKHKIHFDTKDKSLHIETEQVPFAIPNGYFLYKVNKGWKIKEVFHMTKVEPDTLERKPHYMNVECEGKYQDERYLIQKKERIQICDLCQYKMSCMMGSKNKRFETKKDFDLEKQLGIEEWVSSIKSYRIKD